MSYFVNLFINILLYRFDLLLEIFPSYNLFNMFTFQSFKVYGKVLNHQSNFAES